MIAGYRELTGRAALPPRWALGYWQSRERYKTADELLGTVKEFRARRFPLDVIVQDWQYWPEGAWGSHEFDPSRFPDPKATTDAIHALGARVMISVWPKYYPGTANFDELQGAGHLYPLNLATGTKDWLGNVFTNYDAFHPEARRLYWRQVERALFAKGIDAFWLDATEPEVLENQGPEDLATRMSPTALGPGARVLNAYPLMASRAVFEGQRGAAPERRVAILTRSAWAGSQRYAATVWSGDVVGALERPARAGPGGPLVLALRDAVVDDRHRRLQRGRPGRPRVGGLPGALHPLVPVRLVLPRLPLPRHRHRARAVALRPAPTTTRPGRASCASRSCATGCSPTSTRSPRASPASTTR